MSDGEFNFLVESFVEARRKKATLDEELSALNMELHQIEEKLKLKMEELKLEKFSVSDVGTIYQTERFYAKTPKSPEAREEFFNYLRSTGEFEGLITVNSNTMNAWYKAKMEAANSRGEVLEVPGITEVGVIKGLTLRKG